MFYPQMDQFRHLSGLGENDGSESLLNTFGEKPGRGEVGAPRGIEEDHMLTRFRGAGGLNHFNFLLDKLLSERLRIGNGGGKKDELGLGSIKTTNPSQSPDNLAHMASENAPVGVYFVQYHH